MCADIDAREAHGKGLGRAIVHAVEALARKRGIYDVFALTLQPEFFAAIGYQRVDRAQQLANMGDYDWHIPTDTNRWSDQLYRIYGHEPQSFNATYEMFIGNIHPEDRERIQAIHQRAYATGDPYQMIERIVRQDGEVRYLSSNGQVVMDGSGVPMRMVP